MLLVHLATTWSESALDPHRACRARSIGRCKDYGLIEWSLSDYGLLPLLAELADRYSVSQFILSLNGKLFLRRSGLSGKKKDLRRLRGFVSVFDRFLID